MNDNYTRAVHGHEDGLGLNDRLRIHADERDPNGGGASHDYGVYYDLSGNGDHLLKVASIQFQHGPREAEGSVPGVTEAVLYAILIDRLEGFQAGPFACGENQRQLELLRECMAMTRDRAIMRAHRGVLGKNKA